MNTADINKLESENNLDIEIGTTVYLEFGSTDLQISCIFAGMISKTHILLTFNRNLLNLEEKDFVGEIVSVKFLSKGIFGSFQTKIFDTLLKPIELIILEYPQDVLNANLRLKKRYDCLIKAEIRTEKFTTHGAIMDFNKIGCRFTCQLLNDDPTLFQINDQIVLMCYLPNTTLKKVLPGVVRNYQKEDDEVSIGIEFEKISEDLKQVMEKIFFE